MGEGKVRGPCALHVHPLVRNKSTAPLRSTGTSVISSDFTGADVFRGESTSHPSSDFVRGFPAFSKTTVTVP